jgi:hypothetical protein
MTTSRRAPRPNFHRQLAWKSKWPPIHWARTSALPTGLLSCDKNSQLPNQSSAGNPTRHRFGIPAGSEAERWLSKVLTADIPGSHNAKSQLYPNAFPDGAGPRTVKLKLRTTDNCCSQNISPTTWSCKGPQHGQRRRPDGLQCLRLSHQVSEFVPADAVVIHMTRPSETRQKLSRMD